MEGAGGAGGGGSGGSIYIISRTEIAISGSRSVDFGTGGYGGFATDVGGNGGNGSAGRIRLDGASITRSSATIVPGGLGIVENTTPAGILDPLAPDISNLSSEIETSCVYKEAKETKWGFMLQFLMALLLAGLLQQIPKVLRRLRYD